MPVFWSVTAARHSIPEAIEDVCNWGHSSSFPKFPLTTALHRDWLCHGGCTSWLRLPTRRPNKHPKTRVRTQNNQHPAKVALVTWLLLCHFWRQQRKKTNVWSSQVGFCTVSSWENSRKCLLDPSSQLAEPTKDSMAATRVGKRMWVAIYISIRVVLSSNLDWNTGYSDSGFLWFFSVTPDKFRNSTSTSRLTLTSKSFPIHLSSTILVHHTILHATLRKCSNDPLEN
jgi:hypothetical protein